MPRSSFGVFRDEVAVTHRLSCCNELSSAIVLPQSCTRSRCPASSRGISTSRDRGHCAVGRGKWALCSDQPWTFSGADYTGDSSYIFRGTVTINADEQKSTVPIRISTQALPGQQMRQQMRSSLLIDPRLLERSQGHTAKRPNLLLLTKDGSDTVCSLQISSSTVSDTLHGWRLLLMAMPKLSS